MIFTPEKKGKVILAERGSGEARWTARAASS